MLMMWDVGDVRYPGWEYWECGIFGTGLLGLWDAGVVECLGCGILGICDAGDVGCWGCGMFGMYEIWGARLKKINN